MKTNLAVTASAFAVSLLLLAALGMPVNGQNKRSEQVNLPSGEET